jgi:hypothetical protein
LIEVCDELLVLSLPYQAQSGFYLCRQAVPIPKEPASERLDVAPLLAVQQILLRLALVKRRQMTLQKPYHHLLMMTSVPAFPKKKPLEKLNQLDAHVPHPSLLKI